MCGNTRYPKLRPKDNKEANLGILEHFAEKKIGDFGIFMFFAPTKERNRTARWVARFLCFGKLIAYRRNDVQSPPLLRHDLLAAFDDNATGGVGG